MNPTDAQKEAGNYRKGHVQVGQFDISIEQPKGSVRSGVDASGKKWKTKMANTYGYIRGTEGVDGDHIDVFLSDDIDGWNGRKVFVVDQYNEDGSFDEHKVMLGFNDVDDAEAAYFANYDKNWAKKHKTVVTSVNLEDFEKWVDSSHRKTKAFAEYKSMRDARTDHQGNPVNADGSLLVEKIGSINELTDDDFLNASRNVQLPVLPERVDEVIGANGKPVVIKKNIFDKNRKSHKDISPAQSREILLHALYEPKMYGQNQKIKRPYNWILIHNAVKHSSVVLEVNHNKDNVEIVNWHYLEDDTLEQKKRQAINEGGLILTLESAAGNTINDLSSESKANKSSSEKQADKHKKEVEIAPIVKGGTILKNNEAGGDAVAVVVGSEIKNGERRYLVQFAPDMEAAKGKLFFGEEFFSEREMQRWLDDGRFTEIEEESDSGKGKGEYKYRLTVRPFSIGTQPDGHLRHENDGSPYGVVVYDHPLSRKEVENFSLAPITEAKELEGKTFESPFGKGKLSFHVDSVDDDGMISYTINGEHKRRGTYHEFKKAISDKAEEVKRKKRGAFFNLGSMSEEERKRQAKEARETELKELFEKERAKFADEPKSNRYAQGLRENTWQEAVAFYRKKKAEMEEIAKDWASRVYKKNGSTVLVRSDEDMDGWEHKSVDSINESRRRRNINLYMGYTQEFEDFAKTLMSRIGATEEDLRSNPADQKKYSSRIQEDNGGVSFERAIDSGKRFSLREGTNTDAVLRDALVDKLKESGIDVVTDNEAAQRVLDEANGKVKLSAKQKRALETASVSQKEKHHQTAISSADGTNVLKKLDKLSAEYDKDSYTKEKTFIGNIADALGIDAKERSSKYATFETKNGKVVTIRLSNHNATVSNFDNVGETEGISIVVTPKANEGITNDGDAHIVEFYYSSIKLRKADGKPLAAIVRSIKQSLYSGEYKDTTGLAERQEVNAPFEQLREHRVLIADNGEPSNLSDKQWHEVRTEDFKNWFGDWQETDEASQVVDENEEPLVVYHGTSDDLSIFDRSYLGKNTDSNASDEALARTAHVGFWFSTKKIPWVDKHMPVYLNFRNPLRLDSLEEMANAVGEADSVEAYLDEIKREGYDSIIIEDDEEYGGTSYVALDSNQIKSATENVGTFSRMNNDIRFFRTANGEAYGFTVGGKIYLDPKIATAETPIHEYAHLWADALQKFWKGVADFLGVHFTTAEEVL